MLKNITLSAEDVLIQKAREKAVKQKKTLNACFREWLSSFVHEGKSSASAGKEYVQLMKRLSYARPGRKFTREEMNERR